MAQRDVNLIIRAKNDASTAFKQVGSALNDLFRVQQRVEEQAKAFNRAMDGSESGAAALANTLANRTGASARQAALAFERVQEAVEKNRSALAAQKSQVSQTADQWSSLYRQAIAGASALKRAREAAEGAGATDADRKRLEDTERAYAALRRELDKLGKTLKQERTAVAEFANETSRLESKASAARFSVQRAQDLASANRLNAQSRAAQIGVRDLVRELFRLGPAGEAASRGLLQAGRSAFNMRTALAAVYGDSRKALSLMQRLRDEVLSLTASFVGFYAVINSGRSVFDAFAQMEAAENRLGAAFSQDTRSVTSELGYLNNEASRLGISFDTLSDNYSKFLISAKAANFTTQETRTIFRQVSEASRVLKLNNEQITGVLTALTQIAGKGTLQMEELRQQLGDRLPGAVSIMARALGYSSDQLAQFYKDVENGQIDAQRALVAFGAELERTYGGQLEEALSSVTAELGRFQNALFNRKLDAANAGFVDGVTEALRELTGYLESEDGIKFFESLGAAAGKLAQVVPFLVDNFDLITTAFKFWIALKVGQVFAGLIVNMRTATASAAGLRVAVRAIDRQIILAGRSSTALGRRLLALRPAMIGVAATARAMWIAIGGPIGLIAVAIGLFATEVLGGMLTSVNEVDSALSEHERLLQRVQGAYRLAETGAAGWREELEKISSLKIEQNNFRLEEIIANGRDEFSGGGRRLAQMDITLLYLIREIRAQGRIEAGREFLEVSDAFAKGEATAQEYMQAIRNLRASLSDLSEESIDFLAAEEALAEKVQEAEVALERNEAMLRVRNGIATEADKILLGLTKTTEDSIEPAETAAAGYDKFSEALRKLAAHVPELKAEMDRFDSIAKIEEGFEAAIAAARELPDEIMRVAAAWEAAEARRKAYLALDDAQFEAALSGTLVDRIIGVESGGDPTARNPNSTATGLGQFIESTWVNLFEKYFPERVAALGRDEILALREDAALSRQMVELYIRENGNALRAAGQAVNDANLYLAHFLGPQGAINLLSAAPGTSANAVLGAEQIAANQSILDGKTREEVISWAQRKVGVSETELEIAEQLAEADRQRVERAREFHEEQRRATEEAEFQLAIRQQELLDREVAKAFREAELAAQEAGTELTAQQRADIERITREKFAQQALDEARSEALEEARKKEEEISRLQAERQNIEARRDYLAEGGDLAGAAAAEEELQAINDQLEDAIRNAIAFWEALGGDEAEEALSRLRQTQEELGRVEQKVVITGREVNEMFAAKMSNAVTSFLQKIRDGVPVAQALSEAFSQAAAEILIELGKMIVKQAIFNMLAGLFGGGTGGQGGLGGLIGGAINGLFQHTGGIVGNGTARSRPVPIAAFANAVRYHTGGMAGLAPDEYATILQKNEEVLTTGDPRHIFNQKGGSGGSGGDRRPKIVNAFSYDEVVSEALNTPEGEEAFINFVRKNSGTVKAALEG